MFCRQCGKEISDGATFCSHCGTSMGGTAVVRKSGSKTSAIIAVIAVVAAAMTIVGVLFLSGGAGGLSGKYGYLYNPTEVSRGNHYFWEIDFLDKEECLIIKQGYERLPATYTVSGDTIVIKIPSLLSGWSGEISGDTLILNGTGIGNHETKFVKFE